MQNFPIKIIELLEITGTFAFAISGIRLAAKKEFDVFGAYIIGLITAIGGGTLRDVLLDKTPFWLLDPSYFITTLIALIAVILFKKRLVYLGGTLFIFDSIGLGLFTIVGLTKSLEMGLPHWACILMGTITGSFGGVLRDVFINEVPLLFKKDIYALSCVIGGVLYFTLKYLEINSFYIEICSALLIIALRILAVKYHWELPKLGKKQG